MFIWKIIWSVWTRIRLFPASLEGLFCCQPNSRSLNYFARTKLCNLCKFPGPSWPRVTATWSLHWRTWACWAQQGQSKRSTRHLIGKRRQPRFSVKLQRTNRSHTLWMTQSYLPKNKGFIPQRHKCTQRSVECTWMRSAFASNCFDLHWMSYCAMMWARSAQLGSEALGSHCEMDSYPRWLPATHRTSSPSWERGNSSTAIGNRTARMPYCRSA